MRKDLCLASYGMLVHLCLHFLKDVTVHWFILPHFKMLMFQFVSDDVGGTFFSDDNPSSILNSFPSLKILSVLLIILCK